MSRQQAVAGVTIALQPIHDDRFRHVADRLVYRRHGEAEAGADDPVSQMAQALAGVIYEGEGGHPLGERELFIELPQEWLVRTELLPTPPTQIIIGLPAALELTPEVAASLAEIKDAGYRLAVHEPALEKDALKALADVAVVDVAEGFENIDLEALKAAGYRLMAEGIVDHQRLTACQEAGFTWFNGRYLGEPGFHATRPRTRHGNRAAQLRLVNELYRDDADLQKLHDLLIQMPALHMAILRRAGSSFYARGNKPPTELKRALSMLGLLEIRRLVMTLSLASELPSSRLTVRLALIRAFMCQKLAAPFSGIDPEDAFTTGLFSLMDALLEEDQETLLAQVPLAEPIRLALQRREGPLGALLKLCEEHEHQLAERPPEHGADRLQACYLQALAETDSLMSLA
ncbi:HDOD domain-containing protein [Halomonas shengliensis]|uniref:HDOD domain-containing protein n=1 Tax=Halomonas shengliensis TaxID=419597 RepID=A0A1H0F2X1_9GAMM|nr:HDOD domain-containing protein [Halomonas shengliensis]SDN88990.1 HDOD domain-containing protein [Halomonas shengliensis]